MKLIIELDEPLTYDNIVSYIKLLNIDEDFIKSIKFEKDDGDE